jgi:SAM-dependent methyltransferase
MKGRIKTVLKKFADQTAGYLYNQYTRLLEKEIVNDCQTLLDVGCGTSSPIQKFSHKLRHTVGVDCFPEALAKSQSLGIHHQYILADVLSLDKNFAARSFDCVAALDLIEHLPKADGRQLIAMMEKIAKKKIIIFTPNGFLPQGADDNNPWQVHRSGWTVGEMKKLGFRVCGINGLKPLRGEYSLIRLRPTWFWTPISWLSQLVVTNRPEHAFQLLCIKENTQCQN